MILYTSDNNELVFNKARQKAFLSLLDTLDMCFGKTDTTEKKFADLWLENMHRKGGLFQNGWYDPPKSGIAVLTDQRLNFDSLRNENFFSDDSLIDWKEGHLYAYCSPVERSDGHIGDMSVTLYFGKDEKIISHFKNVRGAIQDIFDALPEFEYACDLYEYSLSVFAKRGLMSNMISRTDTSPSNLGHSFTHLDDPEKDEYLTRDQIDHLSKTRRFINPDANWKIEEGMQITIEPQLLSLSDPSLYKVTHHYVVKKSGDDYIICNDIDLILRRIGLI